MLNRVCRHRSYECPLEIWSMSRVQNSQCHWCTQNLSVNYTQSMSRMHLVNLTDAAYVTLTGSQSHGCSICDIDWWSISRVQHKWHWLAVNVTDAAYVTLTGGQSHGCSIRDIDWWSISRMLHIWHWLVGQCHLCCTSDIDWWHWPPLYYHGILWTTLFLKSMS